MRTRTLPILLAVVGLTGCSVLNPAERSITVPGRGEVSVAPDVVSVNLGVQTRNANVATAVAENNRVATAIIQAARNLGVADSDMQTGYFSVYPQPEYDEFGILTDEVTYWVDNTLTVRLRRVDLLSQLLQDAVEAGATNIYGVSFSISDTAAAEVEARAEALADADHRAERIAADAGLTLGEVVSISTGVTQPPPQFYFGPAAFGVGGGGEGPPISSGTNTVAVDVTVSYAIR